MTWTPELIGILTALIASLSGNIVTYVKSRSDSKVASVDAATRLYNEATERIDQLHKDAIASDTRFAVLRGEFDRLHDELSAARARISQLEINEGTLRNRITQLESELERVCRERDALKQQSAKAPTTPRRRARAAGTDDVPNEPRGE
jgi:chromosome segregation ATPase